jgi:hypothetical protein
MTDITKLRATSKMLTTKEVATTRMSEMLFAIYRSIATKPNEVNGKIKPHTVLINELLS